MQVGQVTLWPVPLDTREVSCRDCGQLVTFAPRPNGEPGVMKLSLKSPYCKRDEFMVVVEAPQHQNECSGGMRR